MKNFIGVALLVCGVVAFAIPASALEGRYKGKPGTIKIQRKSGGQFTVEAEAVNRRGVCGLFEGAGGMQGTQLIATTGKGEDVCRMIITPGGDGVAVRTDRSGCLSLHGASCPGFDGAYRRVGR